MSHVVEVVVDGEQKHEREEESEGPDEVPNIVVPVEIHQDTSFVFLPRQSWRQLPIGVALEEKIQSGTPKQRRQHHIE